MAARKRRMDMNELGFSVVAEAAARADSSPAKKPRRKKVATAKKPTWGREIEMIDPVTGKKKKFRFAAN